MKRTKAACMAAAALLPVLGCGRSVPTGPDSYLARLNPAEVVPPAPGNLTGSANFRFEGNSISFSSELYDLGLARQADRFLRLRVHSGARGTNGPPLASVVLMEADIPTVGQRFQWTGQLGAEQLDTAGSVQEVVAAIKEGRAYVVVTHWQIGTLGEQGGWAVEGQGVAPDIEVIDDPGKMVGGRDPQLDAAIDALMAATKRVAK